MTERKLIGQVGVDSGQLMVIDPCYINSHWKNVGEVLGVHAWGEAGEDLVPRLKSLGYVVSIERDRVIFIPANNHERAEAIQEVIRKEAKRIGKVIVTNIKTSSSYDKVVDLTLSKDQAGQLNYELGHAGLGVAFSSGLGDGIYGVYATYKDIENWGRRITKVEIELISDEEIQEL
ncbi:hypothetical protein P8918_13745 [Bacillus spizizenii]|nr:hypothetical protein [Bacillus spizizenii]MCY8890368.1 hypothetical protein [Bacillus spizizenii]MEC0842092.1 hypothetical protein [Bacillus spizizenii]